MSLLLLESFDYYATADLPALWDSSAAVEIQDGVGRAATAAAFFDAAQPSALVRVPTWGDVTTILGFAVLPVTLFTDVTLATFVTTARTFRLRCGSNGVLYITENEVVLPSASGPNQIGVDSGAFIEWRLVLTGGTGSMELRVNEARVAFQNISPGVDTFVSLTIGGGSLSAEQGTFLVDDVYLLDGVPVDAFQQGALTVDNASFWGNTHIQALVPTQEGKKTTPPPPPFDPPPDPSYTAWTPDPGPNHYTMVDEIPPDDGTTREHSAQIGTYSANMLDVYATYGYLNPYAETDPGFGLQPVSLLPWGLFGLQWIAHVATDGVNTGSGTVRQVDDLPTTDIVALLAAFTVLSTIYGYRGVLCDRDPIQPITGGEPSEFTMGAVLDQGSGFPAREFGVTVVS